MLVSFPFFLNIRIININCDEFFLFAPRIFTLDILQYFLSFHEKNTEINFFSLPFFFFHLFLYDGARTKKICF